MITALVTMYHTNKSAVTN